MATKAKSPPKRPGNGTSRSGGPKKRGGWRRFKNSFREASFIRIVSTAGNLAILVFVLTYITETTDRYKERTFRAWLVLSERGVPGNSGKREALEYLNSRVLWGLLKDRSPLVGIDLSTKTGGKSIDLEGINLRGAMLKRANLRGAKLYSAEMTRAYLWRANLSRADLTWVDLAGADLSQANMVEANLRFAKLSRAILKRANLTKAMLPRANLTGVFLIGTILISADLRGANLTGAYIRLANLTNANLRRANLTDASLHGTNLTGANLSSAMLYNVKGFTKEQFSRAFMCKRSPAKNIPAKIIIPERECDNQSRPVTK